MSKHYIFYLVGGQWDAESVVSVLGVGWWVGRGRGQRSEFRGQEKSEQPEQPNSHLTQGAQTKRKRRKRGTRGDCRCARWARWSEGERNSLCARRAQLQFVGGPACLFVWMAEKCL